MTLDVYSAAKTKQNNNKQIQKRQGSGTRITTFSDSKIVIRQTCQPLIKENLETHGKNLEILRKVVRLYFFRPIHI